MNGQTVYVVDDDEPARQSVEVLLSAHGYRTRSFASAEEFLGSVDCNGPGCLITDLQMAGMDGPQFIERLLAADSQLAVVIVTGHADGQFPPRMRERTDLRLLDKPYEAKTLLEAVASGLARSFSAQRRRDSTREA